MQVRNEIAVLSAIFQLALDKLISGGAYEVDHPMQLFHTSIRQLLMLSCYATISNNRVNELIGFQWWATQFIIVSEI